VKTPEEGFLKYREFIPYQNKRKHIDMSYDEVERMNFTWKDGIHWVADQWVEKHHIGHFAYRMLHYFTVSSLRKTLHLHPQLDSIAFVNIDNNMFSWEDLLMDVVLDNTDWLKQDHSPFLWKPDLDISGGTCFRSSYFSAQHEIYFQNNTANEWRNVLYKSLGAPNPKEDCPPKKLTFILRRDRFLLNHDEISTAAWDYVTENYPLWNFTIEKVEINASLTGLEQHQVFSSAGIILGPHSSQFANMLFAPKNAVFMEHKGAKFNPVFLNLAEQLNVLPLELFANKSLPELAKKHRLKETYENCRDVMDVWKETESCTKQMRQNLIRIKEQLLDVDHFLEQFEKACAHIEESCTKTPSK
jgi:hypothetical protein